MKFFFFVTVIAFASACASKAPHHSAAHSPAGHHSPGEMNKKFLDPNVDVEKYAAMFSDEERDVAKYRTQIVKALALKKRQRVADVGAGTGLHVPLLADEVGKKGKVYAVDISPKFVEELKRLALQKNLSQVEAILGKVDATGLAESSVDSILVVDTYHHFDEPEKMLADFRKSLSAKGQLAIVDFNKTPTARQWIQEHIGFSKQQYIEQIEKSGFKLVGEPKIPFKETFMLVFQKQ